MTKCKLCNIDIPDGMEYCQDCLEDNNAKSDESYLDDLLKTVINTSNGNTSNSNISNNKVFKKNNLENIKTIDNEIIPNDNELTNIKKQEEILLKNENDLGQEDYYDNTEDILSLIQDYTENDDILNDELLNNDDNNEPEQDINSEMDDADEDLLALLGMISGQDEPDTKKDENLLSLDENEELWKTEATDEGLLSLDESEELWKNEALDENLLSLDENEYLWESEVANDIQTKNDDILAIDDLLDNESSEINNIPLPYNENEKQDRPRDVGKVFSDVVSALDSLDDRNILDLIPELEKESNKNKNKIKNKKTFWQRLFGEKASIEEDTEDLSQTDKKKESQKKEVIKKKDKDIATQKKESQKKVSKKKVNQKKIKATKIKSDKDEIQANNVDVENNTNKSKKASKKAIEKASKKEIKKANKAAKKKTNSVAQIIEEIEDIEETSGKLSRVRITFVMSIFAIILIFVIIGSNSYSYSLGIKNATEYFAGQRYTQAYNEVYGLDIKEKDVEIYDKIMTVMFVNKQLNSYNNYYELEQYPQALDSLLKGLTRYDKYIKLAKELGIKSDLDSIKVQIISELKTKFNISEEEAIVLNEKEDQTKYSTNVFNAVTIKME